MNVPYIFYYLFQHWAFPLHLCPTPWGSVSSPDFWYVESLQITASSDTLLSALYCLQHPSLLCCISSSEIHLLKSTLLKLSPFPTFHLHVYSSWKLFPFLLHTSSLPIPSTPPIVRTVPSLSYSRAITWILFGASQGPPNYTLQLHHPSKIQFC